MPPINAIVTWDDGSEKGTVADISVPKANGATVITWTCGPNVSEFKIKGLDKEEFSPHHMEHHRTTFSTTDKNDKSGTYTYTVNAKHIDGRESSHDPKIENGT
jgi:hypothetical protein